MEEVRRLNRLDVDFLEIEPQCLMVSLLRFRPRPDGTRPESREIIDRARRLMMAADAPPALAAFRRRVHRVPGNLGRPYFQDDPAFEIGNHVTIHGRASPVPIDEIPRLLLDAMARPLDPARPLWRVELIADFEDGTFGFLGTLHHAVADGAGSFLAFALLFLELGRPGSPPDPALSPGEGAVAPGPRWVPQTPDPPWRTVRQALDERAGRLTGLFHPLREFRRGLDVPTVTAVAARYAAYFRDQPPPPVRPPRRQTLSGRRDWHLHTHTSELLDLRLASRRLSVTITDLFVAATALAWPAVVPEASEVWVLVPVDLRGAGDLSWANDVAYMLVGVPCGGGVLETLRAAHASLAEAKQQDQARTLAELGAVRARLPQRWLHGSWGRLDRSDVVLSNMPGCPVPISCQGAPMCDGFGSSSLVQSSWGKFTFVTFGDVVYGTLVEDGSPAGAGARFDRLFREGVAGLCRMAARRELLARQPQLAAVSGRDIDLLTGAAEEVRYAAGEDIVTAGDPADAFYVLVEGSAVATVGPAGAGPARTLDAGDSFGELGIVTGGIRSATVTAAEAVRVLRMDKASFLGAFHDDPVNLRPVQGVIDGYGAAP